MRLRAFLPSSLALGILGVLFSLGTVIYTVASRAGCHARRTAPTHSFERAHDGEVQEGRGESPCPMMRYEPAPEGTHGI
ncbi:MAG: hypothetical protein AAF627_03080 [Myxococcota bacterium]